MPSPSRRSTTAKAGARLADLLPGRRTRCRTMSPRSRGFPSRATGAQKRLVVLDDQQRAVGEIVQFGNGVQGLVSPGLRIQSINIEHMASQFCTAKAVVSRLARPVPAFPNPLARQDFPRPRSGRGARRSAPQRRDRERSGSENDNLGAGPFQQRAGDEHAKAEAGALARWASSALRRLDKWGSPIRFEHIGRDAGPSSEMTISTVSAFHQAFTSTVVRAKSTAFSRMLPTPYRMAGFRAPTGSRVAATASRTLIATPKSRCGATVSSISVDSGMRSNGAPEEKLGDLGQDVAAALRLLAQGFRGRTASWSSAVDGLFQLRARSGRSSTAACRVHARRQRRGRRAGSDAARASAPARSRPAHRKACAPPRSTWNA